MFRNILKYWVPLAAGFVCLAGAAYLGLQQAYRTGANDPQIQMAQDAAIALAAGQPASAVLPAGQVEISESLSPYVVVYDSTGAPLASSGVLHGAMPELPPGVFDYTAQNGEDRISWQPEPGVRSAIVVVKYPGGYVMAGRSLKEVEVRESLLNVQVGSGLAAALVATLVLVIFFELLPFTRSRA